MSNINANATVTLTVNGKQAQDMLDGLKKKSQDLEKAIENAAKAGNKQQLTRLQRELRQTNRQIAQIESATVGVEKVLRNLDKATPKARAKDDGSASTASSTTGKRPSWALQPLSPA